MPRERIVAEAIRVGTGSDQVELSQETVVARGLVALFVWSAVRSYAS